MLPPGVTVQGLPVAASLSSEHKNLMSLEALHGQQAELWKLCMEVR